MQGAKLFLVGCTCTTDRYLKITPWGIGRQPYGHLGKCVHVVWYHWYVQLLMVLLIYQFLLVKAI